MYDDLRKKKQLQPRQELIAVCHVVGLPLLAALIYHQQYNRIDHTKTKGDER